ncbi:hypothetical protein THAOC_24508, partial [Thalassiosira oceanica]
PVLCNDYGLAMQYYSVARLADPHQLLQAPYDCMHIADAKYPNHKTGHRSVHSGARDRTAVSFALQIETETLDCPPRHPPGSLHSADNASSGRHGGGDDVARPSGLALGVWTHFGDPRRKLRRRRRLRRQRSSNLPSRRPRRGGRAVHELQRRMAVDPYTLAGDLHDRWAHLYRRLKQVKV